MKTGVILSVILAGTLCLSAMAGAGPLPVEEAASFYRTVLDRKIAHCRAKTVYGASRLPNMQATAVLATRKAQFLEANRDRLLDEMAAADLAARTAGVEHFINRRFAEHQEMLSAHYLAFLEKKIADCKAKVGLGRSKLDSMRRKAALSALKAQFMETNREELLAGMLETDLGTHSAKLDHFINLHFYGFVHPRLMTYLTSP